MFKIYVNADFWPCYIVSVSNKDTAKKIVRLLNKDDPGNKYTIHTESLD